MKKYLSIMLFTVMAASAVSGCNKGGEAGKDQGHDEHETVQVTAWSGKSEAFIEYGKNKDTYDFLIHLSRLADNKPVTGQVVVTVAASGQAPATVTIPAPERPGIYRTNLSIPGGEFDLKIATAGPFQDEILMEGLHREHDHSASHADGQGKGEGGDHDGHAEGHGHGDDDHHHEGDKSTVMVVGTGKGTISFLKEQQWNVDFLVRHPENRSLATWISTSGELVPTSTAEATVSAPLSGIISASKPLPYVGQRIAKGDVVAVIDPPATPSSGMGQLSAAYAEAKSRFILAEKELERAKHLVEKKIAPRKRLDEAEVSLASAQAALAPLQKAMDTISYDTGNKVTVRAPISGTVVEAASGAGKGIEAGMPILNIVNTSTLWLKTHVSATDAGKIDRATTARFTVAGMTEQFRPSRLISIGDLLDPQTRTLPVTFEVGNRDGRLKAGQFATVFIRTGSAPAALSLPKEAVIEDEGRFFAFVQTSGEAFERREIRIGIEDEGHVQILEGLKPDEFVVVRGAYYVKLSANAGKGGDSHGHAH